ncbi:MAG: hypothetical protein OEW39_14920, partial [Deltaproteobacteria bacterium]|nr:hypothetical protein [Deltaproteobacteria bacterium]
MNVRVWVGSALSFASAGFLLLLAWPAALVMGFGHPVVPVGMHLLTLGLLVGSAYPALAGLWAGLYGPRSPRPLWLRWAFVCHVSGVIGLVTGFYLGDREWAYWGGHYLAPTGLVLLGLHGIGAARLRPAGSERHLWSHLPVAGLLVTMALGALLVMDALTGKYGLYHPGTIMTHLFSGGFLFLLPLTLLPVKVQSPSTDPGGLRGTPLTLPMLGRYYGPVGAGALAVLIVTTGLVEGADGV